MRNTLFNNLIDIVIQVYIEMLEIINYFSWQNYSRSKLRGQTATRFTYKQPRLASIASSSQKRKSTVDAILGNNESQLRKKQRKYLNPTYHKKVLRCV